MKTLMFIASMMLAICPLVLIVLLSFGCSVLLVPHWDPREYNELVNVAAESSHGMCTQEQVDRLTALTGHLKIYTAFLPNNENIAAGVAQLDATVQELAPSGRVGSTFCQLKLKAIYSMTLTLTQAAGGKPK